jgi:hypothetical protein
MAQSTDLYTILRGYALKNNSPFINISFFLNFLEKYAAHWVRELPEWEKWASETETKFQDELSVLVENDKCAVLSDTGENRIYMPFFCLEKLREIYQGCDKQGDMPFPDESSLKISIPAGQVRVINLSGDMEIFFTTPEKKEDGEAPARVDRAELIKIIFPDDFGSALVPADLIPRRLLEASLYKLRGYLHSHGNKEFMLHKLSPYLPGREKSLRDMLEQLLVHPTDCLSNLESSGDFSSLFWTCLCSLVKTDIKKKSDLMSEDVAAIQGTYIVEVCNMFYKAISVKKRDNEMALRNLEQHLDQPPFYYTLDDIIKFTNDKEIPLLTIYSKQDLENYIRKRTTESKKNELPDWLVLAGRRGERWYIKKNKYLPLCTRMLVGARPHIKKEIISRWVLLMKDFRKEPAMEKDAEFDRLLGAYTMNVNPALMALLDDPKLLLVYSELEQSHASIPPAAQIIKDGKLLPMSTLYAFRRREMLGDVKFMLPFWYSIPVLARIIVFFKKRGKEKSRGENFTSDAGGDSSLENQGAKTGADRQSIQRIAKGIEAALVPPGLTMDEYLSDLEGRWSRLLDEQARRNLVSDVQSLLRDNLRTAIRVYKTKQLSQASLANIAETLITGTPGLRHLGSKHALSLYMQLYMVKMMGNYKA